MKIRVAVRKFDNFKEFYLSVKVLNRKGDLVYGDINGYRCVINIHQKPVLHVFDQGNSWIQYSLV